MIRAHNCLTEAGHLVIEMVETRRATYVLPLLLDIHSMAEAQV